jgi:hypothetical protein
MRVINEVINTNNTRSPCSWIKLRCYWERPEERIGGGGTLREHDRNTRIPHWEQKRKKKNPPNLKTHETEKKKLSPWSAY